MRREWRESSASRSSALTSDPGTGAALPETEIRRLVGEIATDSASAEAAWEALRPLGSAVVPYLAEAYERAKRWQARTALVFHAIPHARTGDVTIELGLRALGDKSYMVRYRACMLLAYGLRPDTLPALREAAMHADVRTAEDARAAIDAIEHRNHHYFVDRTHGGQSFWQVNPGDVPGR